MTTLTTAPARQLATIETITAIAPIPDADAIVRARVRGWDVVVRLGEFTVGDRCLYLEVDSFIDTTDPRFAFLAPRGLRVNADGVTGHALKTARLRGQYSQGLALPLDLFPELAEFRPGDDVTGLLPVIKWEQPIPPELAGTIRGYLPEWISATSEERLQNIAAILTVDGTGWVATEKLDGESTTYWVDPTSTEKFGVCTRNLDLLPSENPLWTSGVADHVRTLLSQSFPGVRAYIQGETYGVGIKKNPLRINDKRFAAFNLRVDGRDIPRTEWPKWLDMLSVPPRYDLTFPTTVEEALSQVETLRSAINPDRPVEGVVWRSTVTDLVTLPDGRIVRASTKVLSNRYLLKNDQ